MAQYRRWHCSTRADDRGRLGHTIIGANSELRVTAWPWPIAVDTIAAGSPQRAARRLVSTGGSSYAEVRKASPPNPPRRGRPTSPAPIVPQCLCLRSDAGSYESSSTAICTDAGPRQLTYPRRHGTEHQVEKFGHHQLRCGGPESRRDGEPRPASRARQTARRPGPGRGGCLMMATATDDHAAQWARPRPCFTRCDRVRAWLWISMGA